MDRSVEKLLYSRRDTRRSTQSEAFVPSITSSPLDVFLLDG